MRLPFLLFALLFAGAASAQAPAAPAAATVDHRLEIGGTAIVVPVDDAWLPVRRDAPHLMGMAEAGLPPPMRLVEMFHTADNIARLDRGENASGHFLQIQAMRVLEPKLISLEDWQALLPQLTEGMASVELTEDDADVAARDRRLSEAAGQETAMRLGRMDKPEVYATTPESVRFLMRVPIRFEVAGPDGPIVETMEVAIAGAIVLVRNKIVMVNWSAIPWTPASAATGRQRLDATVDAMIARNVSDAAVASSPGFGGGIDWKDVGINAAIGAGAGLLIALAAVRRRRKAAAPAPPDAR